MLRETVGRELRRDEVCERLHFTVNLYHATPPVPDSSLRVAHESEGEKSIAHIFICDFRTPSRPESRLAPDYPPHGESGASPRPVASIHPGPRLVHPALHPPSLPIVPNHGPSAEKQRAAEKRMMRKGNIRRQACRACWAWDRYWAVRARPRRCNSTALLVHRLRLEALHADQCCKGYVLADGTPGEEKHSGKHEILRQLQGMALKADGTRIWCGCRSRGYGAPGTPVAGRHNDRVHVALEWTRAVTRNGVAGRYLVAVKRETAKERAARSPWCWDSAKCTDGHVTLECDSPVRPSGDHLPQMYSM
ncbi:hypothetical protein K438DRAFT_2104315 [Mycena galopus ATCC 62051]|nr:hypothetical protein K438DRAFT_2104315 [Mycena galopus ATCC 62051]